ncbi:MAG: transglycosylase domain-containing protein [Bacteroidia bacterium]
MTPSTTPDGPVGSPKRVTAKFEQAKSKAGRKWFRFFRFMILGFVGTVVLAIVGVVLIALSDMPPMDVIENPHSELSTRIYSADGMVLRDLFDEKNRVSVKMEDISPHVINALVATEDVRFREHSGIDPQSFFAIAKEVLSGNRPRGGSTVTMQLARNLYEMIGRERSIWRKLKEMVVAVVLEREFTKEEILVAYLNTVSFVGNTYGIQNGANEYFGKDADSLKIEEAAMLVGLLKATDKYNPRRFPDAAKNRRNTILELMGAQGFVPSGWSLDSLKSLPINVRERSDYRDLGLAPYFTEHLREWLKEWCKTTGHDPYRDGLKIYTTIDSRMQRYAEESVSEHLKWLQGVFNKHIDGKEPWVKDSTFLTDIMKLSTRYHSARAAGLNMDEIMEEFHTPIKMDLFAWDRQVRDTLISPWDSLKYYAKFLETGFMAVDPTNGHIKAWVGGINHRFFKYDHVYTGKRQVGSTFKPFVYCAAFDNGSSPCDVELNQPVFFYNDLGKQIWAPKNADGKIGGFMTLRRGLATSTNLITARVMKRIGPHVVCEWAKKMGIESPLDCVPSLALGTTDLSVFELTGAYGTFANKGIYNRPMFVTRIEDRNGNVLADFYPEGREAISEKTAYMMIDMLRGVVNEPGGTGGRLRSRYKLNMDIGGKTGTTQNQSDGWFMGVTPYMVGGTWVGCSDRRMRFRSLEYGQGASLALPIFGLFMSKVYADSTIGLPKDRFPVPSNFDVELDCSKYDYQRKNAWGDTSSTGIKSIMNPDNE